jgi:hypothetical protein
MMDVIMCMLLRWMSRWGGIERTEIIDTVGSIPVSTGPRHVSLDPRILRLHHSIAAVVHVVLTFRAN